MDVLSDAVEQAARVIQQACDAGTVYDDAGEPLSAADTIARALADAGLLAPAPLRQEWEAVIGDNATVVCDSLDEAQGYGGHIYRRLVPDWQPAEETAP